MSLSAVSAQPELIVQMRELQFQQTVTLVVSVLKPLSFLSCVQLEPMTRLVR